MSENTIQQQSNIYISQRKETTYVTGIRYKLRQMCAHKILRWGIPIKRRMSLYCNAIYSF